MSGLFFKHWKPIEEETQSEPQTEDKIISECPCCGNTQSSKSIINSWKESPREPQAEQGIFSKHVVDFFTEADILRRAKEICFKTGYVRNKDWINGSFTSVAGFMNDRFHLVGHAYRTPQEIVEEWESVDPRSEV